jgi:hypothetical protein
MYETLLETTINRNQLNETITGLLLRLYNEQEPKDIADDRGVILIDIPPCENCECNQELSIGYTDNKEIVYLVHFDEHKDPRRTKYTLGKSVLLEWTKHAEFIVPFTINGIIYMDKNSDNEWYHVVD